MSEYAVAWAENEQKTFYAAVRRLIGEPVQLAAKRKRGLADDYEQGPLTFDWLYRDALDVLAVRSGWEDNWRAGRMSRQKVAALFVWFQREFPDEAKVLENDIARLYGTATQSGWERFLRKAGRFEDVSIAIPERLAARVRRFTADDEFEHSQVTANVPMHRPFGITIDGEREFVIALQWVAGHWSILPLSENRVGAERSFGPDSAHPIRAELKFIEDTESGLHRFAFIACSKKEGVKLEKILPEHALLDDRVLAKLRHALKSLKAESWDLLRANAMFLHNPEPQSES